MKIAYAERIERKVEPEVSCFQRLGAMLKSAITYAPRRRLMYFGKTAARSNPVESMLPATLMESWERIRPAARKNVAARAVASFVLEHHR